MKREAGIVLLLAACFTLTQSSSAIKLGEKEFRLSGYAQGTTYRINYFAEDSLVSVKDVDRVLAEIDSSLSLYKPYSTITRFNNSQRSLAVDYHLEKVFKKAVDVTNQTGGLFDITVKPLVHVWGFGEKKAEQLPDSASIKSILNCVGQEKVWIRNRVLTKATPCIMIDMNGIAQGYSVDVLSDFLRSRNIKNFMVELGGEIRIAGRKSSGALFRVGIEAPGDDELSRPLQKTLAIKQGALTTSGNYRKYYMVGGKRISHIINPKTGFPQDSDLISVTVYAQDAMTADAYDNALMLMGLDEALKFVEAREELAAYFIYKKKDGLVADTACSKFRRLLEEDKKG